MLESGLSPNHSSVTGYHRRLRRRRYLSLTTVLLGFALAALFVGAGLLANQVDTARQSMILRADLQLSTRQLQTVMTLLQDAETGQRGLLLTNKSEYLEPYRNAVGELPVLLREARTRKSNPLLSCAFKLPRQSLDSR